MALFVIGNTEYKNVRIKNAEHLALAMIENGFSNVEVTKRKISNKILTPYRNSQGKFSKEKTGKNILRRVYRCREEIILVEVMKIVPETRILKMLGEDLIKDEKQL